MRPPGGKVAGKSDTSRPSCLSPGTTCLSLWKVPLQSGPCIVSALVQLPQMWGLTLPPSWLSFPPFSTSALLLLPQLGHVLAYHPGNLVMIPKWACLSVLSGVLKENATSVNYYSSKMPWSSLRRRDKLCVYVFSTIACV